MRALLAFLAFLATATLALVVLGAAGSDYDVLMQRHLLLPVLDTVPSSLQDTFNEGRGLHRHEATDIPAPRGTPVVAVDDGTIRKLFNSRPGGLTVYQFDSQEIYCYYYAHLDRYAEGIHEGQAVKRGERLGYVGSTGNASPKAPHLHFSIFKLDPEKKWWTGTAIDPYPLLVRKNAAE
jgi:murein DD-endopeptidase MepM/ murein hydrolase activator NlpD